MRAARLREAFRRRGVRKLYGLALDLNVDQSTISRWTKEGGMSLDHAAALCSHLEISLDWLILGEGAMERGALGDAGEILDLLSRLEPSIAGSVMHILQALAGRG